MNRKGGKTKFPIVAFEEIINAMKNKFKIQNKQPT